MSADAKAASLAAQSPQFTLAPLDCARAATGVWLVKVPKYLAKKWNEAPENTEVGVIRITQSRGKAKQDVMFHLNEALAIGSGKPGDKSTEERVPIEHKFMMNYPGNQALYILKQPPDDASKDGLSIIGKVMQRAECTPVQNDSNYLSLKRETNKQFTEPKRQIKIAEPYIRPTIKPMYAQNVDKKDKTKRLRQDRQKVLDQLFNAFAKHEFYNIKDLVKLTQQPPNYLKGILNGICRYNGKGAHKNMWELKEEFKQGTVNSEQNKKAAADSLAKVNDAEQNNDELMDDDDDDSEDFDDVDDDDLEDVDDDME